MIVTYKYKLYRTQKNQHLHRTIDLAGRAYNHCIALHKRYYQLTGQHLHPYALMKHLTRLKKRPKYTWLRLIPSQALQDVVQRIERSYQLFFRHLQAGIKTTPPTFKKVTRFKSYTLKQAGWKLLDKGRIQIGKHSYKLCKDRPLVGDIKTVTIKRDSLGDLYVCFSLEVEVSQPVLTSGQMAGFDFGLKTFLTVSDGFNTYGILSPQFFKQGLDEVKRANRRLSGKVKGSNHYDYLFFETLNLKGMQRLWGRKVSDYAFGTFLHILQYVAQKKGKVVAFVDRFFPSSKTCQHCGAVNQNLSLRDRWWRCPNCQKMVDRDGNASVNILREGASSLAGVGVRPGLSGLPAMMAEPYAL